ncbi:MAG: DUF2231 domain-containing protein, partial [Actinocatenispora sp.]
RAPSGARHGAAPLTAGLVGSRRTLIHFSSNFHLDCESLRAFQARNRWAGLMEETTSVLTEISGLPAHVLLVHAVVVLVPLAALALVGAALWPALRRQLGIVTPLVALVALVFVPATTSAGEWLEHRVPEGHLVEEHTELGDTLLPWVIGLFVMSLVVWGLYRWRRSPFAENGAAHGGQARGRGAVRVVLAVLALAVSVGSVVQIYRIGESGARAAWQGEFQQTAAHSHDRDED